MDIVSSFYQPSEGETAKGSWAREGLEVGGKAERWVGARQRDLRSERASERSGAGRSYSSLLCCLLDLLITVSDSATECSRRFENPPASCLVLQRWRRAMAEDGREVIAAEEGVEELAEAVAMMEGSRGAGVGADAGSSGAEDLVHKARGLMRRIVAGRASPSPCLLHSLAAILEQEESRCVRVGTFIHHQLFLSFFLRTDLLLSLFFSLCLSLAGWG